MKYRNESNSDGEDILDYTMYMNSKNPLQYLELFSKSKHRKIQAQRPSDKSQDNKSLQKKQKDVPSRIPSNEKAKVSIKELLSNF